MEQRRFVTRAARGWQGVEREGYVPGERTRVVRHSLVGGRKASPDEPGPTLEVRYFEVPPGAATRLEKHEHEHFVIVGEGEGHAVVGTEVCRVGPLDVVYVPSQTPHQFVNRAQSTFGFYCVVSAQRDAARLLDADELSRLTASPAGAFIDPNGAPPPRGPVT
jgi:S-methyl-1-thioxylulose 5-phosphate methylthiotransferase